MHLDKVRIACMREYDCILFDYITLYFILFIKKIKICTVITLATLNFPQAKSQVQIAVPVRPVKPKVYFINIT